MSESSPPPAKPPASSGESPQESLQKGLNALKRKDYTTAIRFLATLPQDFSTSGSVRVKAQIGLVRAYRGNGQIAEAIALCQPLTNHPRADIQTWAQNTLRKLEAHHSSTSTLEQLSHDTSGFQPLEPASEGAANTVSGSEESSATRAHTPDDSRLHQRELAAKAPQPSPSAANSMDTMSQEADEMALGTASEIASEASPEDTSNTAPEAPETVLQTDNPSGFQPLDISNDTASLSGFVPLTPEAPSPPPEATDAEALDTEDAEAATTAQTSISSTTDGFEHTASTADIATPNGATVPPEQPSLFHYEQLNSLVPPAEQPPEDAVSALPTTPADAELETELPPTEEEPPPWQFQYAGRLERLRPLSAEKGALLKIWGIQAVTVIVLFWVLRAFVQWTLSFVAGGLELVEWLVYVPTQWQYRTHTFPVVVILAGLLFASPWFLDWVLKRAYRQKSLLVKTLKETHPEASRLLGRIVQQRSWVFPVLKELPTDAPLMFSYGWLPRYGRIVVSRGLLKRLSDDEFAALMGYELTHFTTWTAPIMSMIGSLLLLLHQSYWQTAQWGDRQNNRLIKTLAAVVAILSYTLYWVFRKVSIPLSRVRVHECDRQATEWTGNPNALVRALIKLEAGLAETVSVAGQTPPLVESTELLTPSGYAAAISRGSIYPNPAFLKVLQWDIQNPYRHWLAFNSSHPLLGERLQRLTGYALQWQLPPEVPPQDKTSAVTLRSKVTFQNYWFPFLQQISPYISPIIGIVVVMVLWFVGGLVRPIGIWQVSWLYGDQSVLRGGVLLGVGIGIMLRINRYFPDIIPASRLINPALPDLLANAMALPTDSRPMRLQGTLLGRRGIANWLCQDLILKTSTGLLKLHFLS
ncbi:MAG: M48 family metalloprotease, partial [Cyanobacteria bacterium J06559_3]